MEKSEVQPPPYPASAPPAYQQHHTIGVMMPAESEFGTTSVVTNCTRCHQTVTTRVDNSIKDNGWLWCILCSLCFSWIIGCLACWMNGFKKFTHTCPKCGHVLAVVKPEVTSKEKGIIGALVVLVLVLLVVAAILYIISGGSHRRVSYGYYA